MAFERSTPLVPMGREPVEKPFIPRGLMQIAQVDVVNFHTDGTVTFAVPNASFMRTYHRARITYGNDQGGNIDVLVTPQTVVTWERLA